MAEVFEAPRDTLDAPCDDAFRIAAPKAHGERFVLVRKGRGLMRYDASEWVVHKRPEVPRILHDVADDHACLNRVGFGFTKRAALRSMRRCAAEAIGVTTDEGGEG